MCWGGGGADNEEALVLDSSRAQAWLREPGMQPPAPRVGQVQAIPV